MTEEIIIDGELSCDNCLEKTRCKQQQEVKKQRVDAILSYIANEDNEKYIAELKSEIPAITRCDVVLEKQLKRLEQENKELRAEIDDLLEKKLDCKDEFGCQELIELKQENKELKENVKQYCEWLDEERESNEKLQKVYQNDHCDLLNYRSALGEIRVIADDTFKVCDDDCGNARKIKLIINRINEVLQ